MLSWTTRTKRAIPWLTRHSAKLSFSRIRSQKSLRYGWSASWSIVSTPWSAAIIAVFVPWLFSSAKCTAISHTALGSTCSLSSRPSTNGWVSSSSSVTDMRSCGPGSESDDASGGSARSHERASSESSFANSSSCGAANLSPIRGRFGRCAGASAAMGDSSPK